MLRLDVTRIDVEKGLFDMGMDSLMALDLKTRLETARTAASVDLDVQLPDGDRDGGLSGRPSCCGSRPAVAAAAPVSRSGQPRRAGLT